MDIGDDKYIDYVEGLTDKEAHKHFGDQLLSGARCFNEIKAMIRTMDVNMKDIVKRISHIENEFSDERSYERHKKNVERHKEEMQESIIKGAKLLDALKNLALPIVSVGFVIYTFIK